MKRIIMLLVLAVLIGLYLTSGAMAFNSPISPTMTLGCTDEDDVERGDGTPFPTAFFPTPCPPDTEPEPTSKGRTATPSPPTATATVGPIVTVSNEPVYEGLESEPPVGLIVTPIPTITSVPFVPVSPIFHSPGATPNQTSEIILICVAPGRYGQIMCYEVW